MEQLFFVGEVLVDRAAGVAGRRRDLVERCALEAALGEHGRGCVEQRLAGALPSAFGRPLLDRHVVSLAASDTRLTPRYGPVSW